MRGRVLALGVSTIISAAIAVAACSSKSDPKGNQVTPSPEDAGATRDAKPTRAPIVVDEPAGTEIGLSLLGRYKDPAFGASGLPAVSSDGTQIAYGEERLDGGRGNPNYRLVIRAVADDRPLVQKEILAPSPRWKPEDEAIVRGRIDEANQLLAKTTWQAMTPMVSPSEVLEVLRAGDQDLAIRGSRLVLVRAGRVRLRRPLTGLLKTNAGCPGKVVLAAAYLSPRALLVTFQYETDGCWREAETHALALAP